MKLAAETQEQCRDKGCSSERSRYRRAIGHHGHSNENEPQEKQQRKALVLCGVYEVNMGQQLRMGHATYEDTQTCANRDKHTMHPACARGAHAFVATLTFMTKRLKKYTMKLLAVTAKILTTLS